MLIGLHRTRRFAHYWDATAERMGLDKSKVMINIDRYGNTTAATVPLALSEWWQSGKLKKGHTVVIANVRCRLYVGVRPREVVCGECKGLNGQDLRIYPRAGLAICRMGKEFFTSDPDARSLLYQGG